MPKITLFPVGTADTTLLDLADGQKVLVDYCHRRTAEDVNDPRIDLADGLRTNLRVAKRNAYDVVAFTHLDDDHCAGAADFFWLEYAKKYQSDERIRIKTMWVPAAAILDDEPTSSSWPLRQEARHRLIEGKGIRVFSRPDRLREWLKSKNLTLESRADLISDAGSLVSQLLFLCNLAGFGATEAVAQTSYEQTGLPAVFPLSNDTPMSVWTTTTPVNAIGPTQMAIRKSSTTSTANMATAIGKSGTQS
jgi:hypothetical protein